jgi:hypothetical protein
MLHFRGCRTNRGGDSDYPISGVAEQTGASTSFQGLQNKRGESQRIPLFRGCRTNMGARQNTSFLGGAETNKGRGREHLISGVQEQIGAKDCTSFQGAQKKQGSEQNTKFQDGRFKKLRFNKNRRGDILYLRGRGKFRRSGYGGFCNYL